MQNNIFVEQFVDIYEALENDATALEELLRPLHPADIAFIIESLPSEEQRLIIWHNSQRKIQGDILFELNDSIRQYVVQQISTNELIYIASKMDHDELADIFQDMPAIVSNVLLESMETQHRERFESVLSFPEDTAGGLMNTDVISIRADINVETVFRYLRRIKSLPDTTDKLFVVNTKGVFKGVLYLSDLLTCDPGSEVKDIINQEIQGVSCDMPSKKVVALFERRDLLSAAVVDEHNKLLGRITIDDVVDLIREEGEHHLMGRVGLSEEDDMFGSVWENSKKRAVWLGLNLITALMASFVIGLFQLTIEKMVALAVLMPVVASMGGIAGSQTLTLVVRGMALGQLTKKNLPNLITNELLVALINGVLWAVILAIITSIWFDSLQLSVIIGVAIIANLFVAALSGVVIPKLIEHFGADPALGGSVVLTTVTDMIGFFVFLGLATQFLI